MRIRDVCINRSTVSVHFPIGRNRNFFPAGNIVVRFIEIDRTLGRLFYPIEFPVAVQQLVARRVLAKPGFAVVWRTFQAFHGREGDISRMPRLLVDSEDSFVLPIFVTGHYAGQTSKLTRRPCAVPVTKIGRTKLSSLSTRSRGIRLMSPSLPWKA